MATQTPTPSRNDKSGRRRKVTKFALAGVAVLGVGAALTSAAWTDNVLFGGSAAAGHMDLAGRVQGDTVWHMTDLDSGTTSIPINPLLFADMGPEDERDVVLELKNEGGGDVVLADPSLSGLGTLFDTVHLPVQDADDIRISFDGYDEPILGPGESTFITMTLRAPNWDDSAEGAIGTFVVDIQGTVGTL